ncbi:hypothetical protein BPORC_2040 [Bifidobacterium porcinum]|nr:hypothetical protein BPORC_2040 [Bifidobacterium porcinum]
MGRAQLPHLIIASSMKCRELNPGNGNDFMVLEIQVMWPDIIITITSHKFIEFILSHG